MPDGTESDEVASRVRIYFDGLVAHVHLFGKKIIPESYIRTSLGNGADGLSIIFGLPFEESRQYENIKTLARSVVQGGKKMERTKRAKRQKKKK